MKNLFSNDEPEIISLDTGELELYESFLSIKEGMVLFDHLLESLNWKQNDIRLFGKDMKEPRLSNFMGDKSYKYSNINLSKRSWDPTILGLKNRIEKLNLNYRFNTAFLNLYRNGNDSMGWHSDDEKELGVNPIIASLSLGATRKFQIKPKFKGGKIKSIDLNHGTLLIMKGEMQHFWKHAIPKQKSIRDARINITFRDIKE